MVDSVRLYKVKELVIILGVSDRTVRKWMADGKIKYVKFGRNVRIEAEELEKFIRGGE